jgi:D-sedoheptulose 7-phosphate isomerase
MKEWDVKRSPPGPQIGSVADYFRSYRSVLDELPQSMIERVIDEIYRVYNQGCTIFLFGNGGSAALASHTACDLAKGTVTGGRRRLRAISLTDNIPIMTAWANDVSYEHVFSEQLKGLLETGDLAFAISGSGNSPNVLRALQVARERGAYTIGLGGFKGGKMKALCDLPVIVPSDNMQIIEDFHLSITHAIFTAVRGRISSDCAAAAEKRAGAFD